MKSFIRENPTITFGLGLPLLMVVVFLLLSASPGLLVAPPQYPVLYATEYDHYQTGVQISVVDQKVRVSYLPGHKGSRQPRLWRYDPETGAVREIVLELPSAMAAREGEPHSAGSTAVRIPLQVPDLDGLKVDASSIAPDGYEFSFGADGYSRNPFGGLFYSSRYRHSAGLKKNGRLVRLPNTRDHYYGGQIRFIGWVVSP